MIVRSIVFFVSILFSFLFSLPVAAGNDYRSEIGPVAGSSLYIGDARIAYPHNAELTYGLVFRYRFDQRLALKAEWNTAKTSGGYFDNAAGIETHFRNDITALDLCGEFNFFNYAQRLPQRTAKKYATYIFAGAGIMAYPYASELAIHPAVSFGAGFKVKLLDRLNLNFQYANRLLLADNMEGVDLLNDNARLNGSNFLNNDLLASFTVGLTFDLWVKNCKCIKWNP
ncbi:MAG: DUF6089 family protein [Prevotellaceae bacterium]|jgi:hypothetical protein|nr:DUF6089 family protein [Prevotellaceae bacterium]